MPLDGMDNVKKMIAKNKRDANENIRGVYLAGLSNIIRATPTDTGRARNNWFLSVGVLLAGPILGATLKEVCSNYLSGF